MRIHTKNIQKLHTWSYLCAVCVIILSFGFWTWVVTEWCIAVPVLQGEVKVLSYEEGERQSQRPPVTAALLTQESLPVAAGQPADLGHASAPVVPSEEETIAPETAEKTELQEWDLAPVYTLSIPKIGVRTAVYQPTRLYWDQREWNLMEEQMQVGLSYGAVAYPNSVQPGRRGNVIIAGHSSPPDARAEKSTYGWLFRKLPELEEGDTISVLRGGNFVDYTVTSIAIVSPNTTEILAQQTKQPMLKLITCYPIGTTKDRWVVTAVQTNAG